MSILGNVVGCYSPIGKTFIIEDDSGNQITGVVTDQEVIFTAGDNDVREGMVYAGDSGVSEGTKNIPAYRTITGTRVIKTNNQFTIPFEYFKQYDYTKLQGIICPQNARTSAEMIILNDCLYSCTSGNKISDVTKDLENKLINLNFTSDTQNYLIYYFTYREEVEE